MEQNGEGQPQPQAEAQVGVQFGIFMDEPVVIDPGFEGFPVVENQNQNEADDIPDFLSAVIRGLDHLSPQMRELAKNILKAMLDQYLWDQLNGFAPLDLPPQPRPPLPRYSPHG